MKTTIALILAATIGLSGCTALQAVLSGNSAAQAAPQTVATAEKTLTLAHLAYQGLGDGLKHAADIGLLHGASAATAKVLYDKAGDALAVADSADAVANTQGIINAVAQANDLINQASALTKVAP